MNKHVSSNTQPNILSRRLAMFGKENASVQSTNREEKTDPHVAKRPTTWRRDCCNRALPQRDRLLSPGAAALRPQLEAAADATQQQ
jgi:hypothetical protein